jgi:hypothetical protein
MAMSLRPWGAIHLLFWLIVAGAVCWWRGPSWLRAIEGDYYPYGQSIYLPDFIQEWASARNRFNGLPIYTPQHITVERYLGMRPNLNDPYFIELNAHPPTAVLLGVPFAALDFEDAFALWNMLSLLCLAASGWLIVEQLDLRFSPWALLPAVALLLTCYPLYNQMLHCQLNLVLLLLITGVWAADRQGHPRSAGTLLGLATAIKFYPGFLFLYFLLRRDWSAIRAGLLAIALITGLTAVVLGPEAYSSYFLEVLPVTLLRRADWQNLSLSGLWCKLFDAPLHLPRVQVQPLTVSPPLALIGMVGTLLAVSAVLAFVFPRSTPRPSTQGRGVGVRGELCKTDLAFGLTIIGMLLVSPMVWDHYLIVLALPLPIIWQQLRGRWIERIVLLLLLAVLWLPPWEVMQYGLACIDLIRPPNPEGRWIAGPLEILTVLSVPCYALIGIFALGFRAAWRKA